MNEFTRLDNEGRDLAIKLFRKKVTLHPASEGDCYDLYGTSPKGKFLVEVKKRKCTSTQYDSDALEYKKLSSMRNEDREANLYYLMLFTDKVARLYNLKEVTLSECYIKTDLYPSTTAGGKGNEIKLMIDLPTHQARTFRWK
jgi:predicted HTH domain antitoxin